MKRLYPISLAVLLAVIYMNLMSGQIREPTSLAIHCLIFIVAGLIWLRRT